MRRMGGIEEGSNMRGGEEKGREAEGNVESWKWK